MVRGTRDGGTWVTEGAEGVGEGVGPDVTVDTGDLKLRPHPPDGDFELVRD